MGCDGPVPQRNMFFKHTATMQRQEALELLKTHVKADNLIKHCLASEAILRSMAHRLSQDVELWGLVGLLHDLDFEVTRDNASLHGLRTVELLSSSGLPKEALDAILRHNAEALGLERTTLLDYALTCAETMTGLAVAAALVHPDKRMAGVKAKSVQKRMKSKDFARNVNRDHILLCEKVGIPLMEFIELSLDAMTSISEDLGL